MTRKLLRELAGQSELGPVEQVLLTPLPFRLFPQIWLRTLSRSFLLPPSRHRKRDTS